MSTRDGVALRSLGLQLREAGYETGAFCHLLGLPDPVEDVLSSSGRYSLFYFQDLARARCATSVLCRLFFFMGPVPRAELSLLPPGLLRTIEHLGLLHTADGAPGQVVSRTTITEYRGGYFLSDPLFANTIDDFVVIPSDDFCMPPHASSLQLLRQTVPVPGGRTFLDIGGGSGCQAILSGAPYEQVTAVDINPRCTSFTTENAQVNGRPVECFTGSWTERVGVARYDHVVFNAPHCPVARTFIAEGAAQLLTAHGLAQVWTYCELGPGHDDVTDLVRRWAGPDLAVQVVPFPDSLFSVTAQQLRDRQLPAGSLLVGSEADAAALVHDLVSRQVTQVVEVVINLRPGASRAG